MSEVAKEVDGAISTLKSLGWLSPDQLAARDAEVARAALEMAAKIINKRWTEYDEEFGNLDWDTGVKEYPENGNEMVCEWQELEEAILALALAPPATGMKLVPVADLQEIAKQHLPAELTYGARRDADFEGAYHIIVSKVRAMLAVKS